MNIIIMINVTFPEIDWRWDIPPTGDKSLHPAALATQTYRSKKLMLLQASALRDKRELWDTGIYTHLFKSYGLMDIPPDLNIPLDDSLASIAYPFAIVPDLNFPQCAVFRLRVHKNLRNWRHVRLYPKAELANTDNQLIHTSIKKGMAHATPKV